MLKFLSLSVSVCRQDLQERFAGSLLGSLWLFIWPLVQLLIYIVIFGKLMGARLGINDQVYSYGVYVASGLLCWTMFSTALVRCTRSLIDRSNIIRKVKVNLAVFPTAVCMGDLLPFAAGLCMLMVVDLSTGWIPSPALLALLVLALYCLLILTYGLGLFFACLTVFARDIAEIVPIILQMVFWFTPIVYLPSILPAWLARWLWLNPMTAITGVFQQCFVLGGCADWAALGWAVLISHFFLAAGLWTLRRSQKDILDVV